MNSSASPTIAVAICTYNRTEELAVPLEALLVSVARLAGRAIVGVVVDDPADGKAINAHRSVHGIHFYNSMVVIGKKSQKKYGQVRVGS
jgi:GT2 family glycosyltransferase